ncbi:SspB family protein [Bosea sp. NPDC055332]
MTKDILRYDLMVQDALKGVVRKILAEAGRDGLPGEHHFYITFRTTAPGVRLSQRLREKHPDEMTIVLQHQFWDLNVSDHAFEVGLSFSGVPERLLIPYDAITTFFDPSVQFGLKFETQDAGAEAQASEPAAPAKAPRGAASEPSIAPAAPLALPPKPAQKALPASGQKEAAEADAEAKPEAEEEGGAQVVSLDAFRKKT